MASSAPLVNKPLVGIIALVCLTGSMVLLWFPQQSAAQAASLRVGILMAALWLSLPPAGQSVRAERLAGWLAGAIILIVLSRKMVLFILPAAAVIGVLLYLLRPRDRGRPRRR